MYGLLESRENAVKSRKLEGENKKFLNVAKEIGAETEKTDISIAHRLPGQITNPRPMIVRFSRRVAKVVLLRKK